MRFDDGFYEKYSFYGGKTKYFLVFSTVKDTTVIFYDYLGKESGMNRIKKVKDNLYKTELLLANMVGQKFWMSTIFYDKNYRIVKMEKSGIDNYVLENGDNR